MALAAGTRDGLRFEGHHLEVVVEATPPFDGVKSLHQLGVLGGDARGVLALVPVVIGTCGGAQLVILGFPLGVIVAKGDQGRRTDGNRIRAKRHAFGHVRPGADAARNDELHFAVHSEILERAHRLADTGKNGLAHVFDEHILRRRRAALHPVENDHIGPGLDRQRGVEIGACAADLDIDRHPPAGDLAQFQKFDFQIVRPGPVGVTAG